MKTKCIIGSLLFIAIVWPASAQRVENDDMYFNAKDREKLKAAQANAFDDNRTNSKKKVKAVERESIEEAVVEGNPTDSYSARTVNPEYISRSNAQQATEEESYFVEGYTPATPVYSANTNSPYSNQWNNNYYRNSWYGNPYAWGYDPFYSPYYGYSNPWMSPYYGYGSGWSFTMSYAWGNCMRCGWGNPYAYYGYSPYSFWGYPYGNYYGSGYYYENVRTATYGKRPSRHSALVTPTQRTAQAVTTNDAGRIRTTTRTTADEYYVRPSRRTTSYDNTSSTYSADRTRSNTTSDYSNTTRTRDTSINRSSNSGSSYSTPSRSSSSSGGGVRTSSPTRSSGGGSGSSRSRGN
jgi:hypothetical protein